MTALMPFIILSESWLVPTPVPILPVLFGPGIRSKIMSAEIINMLTPDEIYYIIWRMPGKPLRNQADILLFCSVCSAAIMADCPEISISYILIVQ